MNTTNLSTQSTKTMKKLKVYGEKDGTFKPIATIYVKDKKVVVEAEILEIKTFLEESVESCFNKKYGGVPSKGGFRTKNGREVYGIVFYPPKSKRFLEVLEYCLRDICENKICKGYKFSLEAWKKWEVVEE